MSGTRVSCPYIQVCASSLAYHAVAATNIFVCSLKNICTECPMVFGAEKQLKNTPKFLSFLKIILFEKTFGMLMTAPLSSTLIPCPVCPVLVVFK
jgi:hypothetical protein